MAPRRYRKELFLRRDGQGEPREMTDDQSVTSHITLTVAIIDLPSIENQITEKLKFLDVMSVCFFILRSLRVF
jgi:hypothetical protein